MSGLNPNNPIVHQASPGDANQLPSKSLTEQQQELEKKQQLRGFKRWFWTLVFILSGFGLVYVGSHWMTITNVSVETYGVYKVRKTMAIGYEHARLNESQLAHVGLIYVAKDTGCNTPCKADKVLEYLDNYYNGNFDTTQRIFMRRYLSTCTDEQALSFLKDQRINIKSYFWLTGPAVYFEIMFWAFFGVLCSLLYMLSDVHRKSPENVDTDNPKDSFDPKEIPYQIAKMFYAPITILVVILGYNFISGAHVQDIETSKGMLVAAFLGGFFSARVMALLSRLKDALLPTGNTVDNGGGGTTGGDGKGGDNPGAPPPGSPGDQPVILDVDPVLDPALRQAILKAGLSKAAVVLTNSAGQALNAIEKSGESPIFTYIASGIVPGKYIVTAEWEGTVNPSEAGNDDTSGQDPQPNEQPQSDVQPDSNAQHDPNQQPESSANPQPIHLVAREEVTIDAAGKELHIIMHMGAH